MECRHPQKETKRGIVGIRKKSELTEEKQVDKQEEGKMLGLTEVTMKT